MAPKALSSVLDELRLLGDRDGLACLAARLVAVTRSVPVMAVTSGLIDRLTAPEAERSGTQGYIFVGEAEHARAEG